MEDCAFSTFLGDLFPSEITFLNIFLSEICFPRLSQPLAYTATALIARNKNSAWTILTWKTRMISGGGGAAVKHCTPCVNLGVGGNGGYPVTKHLSCNIIIHAPHRPMQIYQSRRNKLHQSTATSTWWCGPPTRLGWVKMAVELPEGPSYPGHSPSFSRYAAPWMAAEGQHTASLKSVACFLFLFFLPFSCPSSSLHSSPSLDKR